MENISKSNWKKQVKEKNTRVNRRKKKAGNGKKDEGQDNSRR